MAKGSCRCKSAECEECPEWIFTFADLVMLMMGFFVILWVLKPAPDPKKGAESAVLDPEVIAAIRKAFDYLPDPHSNDPIDKLLLMQKLNEMKPMKGPGDGGKTKIERKGPQGTDPENASIRPGKHAIVGGRAYFPAGSMILSPEANKTLDEIATLIAGHWNIVVVKGHTATDDFPDGAEPQQKMDLSLRRAQAVADYLTAKGVRPDTLRVQGCSTFEPVVQQAYSDEARAQNRRAEVEGTDSLVPQRQDQTKVAVAPAPLTDEKPADDARPDAPRETALDVRRDIGSREKVRNPSRSSGPAPVNQADVR